MRTQDPQSTYWELQHMRLSQREGNTSIADLQPSDIARLQDIVALEDEGSSLAFSWLLMLGHPMELEYDLPTRNRGGTKSLINVPTPAAPSQALAYPNPSKGNFQLYHVVPEGVTHVHISIKDALGRELMSKDLSANGGVADVTCPQAIGLHFLSLYYDGILMETIKLNLMR